MNSSDTSKDFFSPYSSSIINLISGSCEGLSLPFVLVTGLSRVVKDSNNIFTAGLLAVAVGAVTMGLGRYWVSKTEAKEQFRALDDEQSVKNKEEEKEKIRAFYNRLNLPDDIQTLAATEVIKDKNEWNDLMEPLNAHSLKNIQKGLILSALFISCGYAFGGLLSIFPYTLFMVEKAMPVSIGLSLFLLFVFGFIRGKLIGIHPFAAAIRIFTISAVAAAAAYWVAGIFTS